MPNQSMRGIDWLLLAFLSLLWGSSFLWMGLVVGEVPPFTVVASRVSLAAVALYVVVRLSGERLPRDPMLWRDMFIMAAINNLIPFSLIAWGQTQIPAGLAAILNATTPLFTVLVLRMVDPAERIGLAKAAGLALGFVGVAVLLGPKALAGADLALLGALAVVVASLFYGLSGAWGRRFRAQQPAVTACCVLTMAAVQAVPVALLVDRPWTLAPGMASMGAVTALGLFSTGLAYLIFYRIFRRAGPANASLVTFLVPVSAILLSALVLGERLQANAFVGMALIFVGLAAIDGRAVARLSRRGPVAAPVPETATAER